MFKSDDIIIVMSVVLGEQHNKYIKLIFITAKLL